MTEFLQVDQNSYYRKNEHGYIFGMIDEDVAWIAAFLVPSLERSRGYGSDFLSKFEEWSETHAVKEIVVILKTALLTDEATLKFFQNRKYVQDPDLRTFFTKEFT